MRSRLLIAPCLIAAFVVAACGVSNDSDVIDTAPTEPLSTSVPPTLQPANAPATTPSAALVDRLRADLSGRTGVAPADVTIVSLTIMTWPDGCLGLGGPGVVCTQALVPGWLATLGVPGGREYRYRGAGDRFAIEP